MRRVNFLKFKKMRDIQEVFDEIQELKTEQKEIRAEYKDALTNANAYEETAEKYKELREKKKQIESATQGRMGARYQKFEEIKNKISHRAKAVREAIDYIETELSTIEDFDL